MKKESIVIWIYAALLIVGGLMGYIKAGSLISIAVSGGFAVVLFACGYGMLKSNLTAFRLAVVTLLVLLAFFAYRLALTGAIMPAGMMVVVTGITLLYLLFGKSKFK